MCFKVLLSVLQIDMGCIDRGNLVKNRVLCMSGFILSPLQNTIIDYMAILRENLRDKNIWFKILFR